MATQIVMDHTGDRRHQFDPQNTNELAEAEKRFKELTGLGFTAAARTAADKTVKIASFDPTPKKPCFFLASSAVELNNELPASNLARVARPAAFSCDPPAIQDCQKQGFTRSTRPVPFTTVVITRAACAI
jgi:hypothetical protein